MTFTVKEICERIWELEERYELNHMEIQGTYPWLIIRMYVYYEITRKTQVFESAQQASLSLFDKVKSFAPFIKNSLLNNPFSGGKCDVLIFDHPRKVIFQNEYKDIYSYFLPQTLKENGKSFEIVESPYLNKHFTSKSYQKKNNVRFNDRILLGSFINKSRNRGKVPFTEDEKSRIDLLKNELETAFSIEIDLFRIIEDHILNFKYDYEKYLELLEKKQPKQVFLVVAYENKALVSACHEKNIEVIELQHGTISPYHLGYSYPKETCKKDGKYGFVDSQGNVVVDYIYDEAKEQNTYGFAAVKLNGLWGAIDKSGRTVLQPQVNLDNNIYIDFIREWHLADEGIYYTK